jgi:hypothetical protein
MGVLSECHDIDYDASIGLPPVGSGLKYVSFTHMITVSCSLGLIT